MRATDFITEIEKLEKNDYTGGKSELKYVDAPTKKKVLPLPGGSGLQYAITGNKYSNTIIILDPAAKSEKPLKDYWENTAEYNKRIKQWEKSGIKAQIVAKLSVYNNKIPGIPDAVKVGAITVDEDYRGIGLAKALYGIVLTIMKKTLIAGGEQTPGGRRNWLSIANIPGVEVKGFVQIDNDDVNFDPRNDGILYGSTAKQVDKNHDKLMHMGGQFIGKDEYSEYWGFDLIPGKNELRQFKNLGINVLYDKGQAATGMYAKWVGNE